MKAVDLSEAIQVFPGSRTNQITACVVCRNEADKLGPCLESITWVDEIIVMDLESQDESTLIARAYGARVISRSPFPIVEPLRNELAAIALSDWILALDPDERISPGLAIELRRIAGQEEFDAVVIPRMNWDFGYPPSSPIQRYEHQLRMYRKSRVSWPVVPNALPVVDEGRNYRIPDRDEFVIVHERSRNIPEVLERFIRYSPAQAQSMLDQGQEFTAAGMLRALARQVDKEFFLAEAWKDGVPGMLRASVLVAFKLYVWASFWQLSGAKRTKEDDRLVYRFGLVLRAGRWLLGLFLDTSQWIRKVFDRAGQSGETS